MDNMVTTELRSLLSQYKDIVSIKPEESYKLVTISNKGIIHLRNIVHGVEIKGDTAYRIKAGAFIYSRLAAHTGSFGLVPPELDGAIVTNEMPVFEINQDIILADYLLYLLRQKKFLNILFQLTKGMGRIRIKEESLLDIKLLIHKDIADQKRVIDSLDSKFENIEAFDNTRSEQIEIITQTRQVLLQEALEGKLTAKWRREHPALISGDNHASKLLEKIKSEKERLVKEGKIRKEKSLTPIAHDEKPFDIPGGWVWCRLGELGNAEKQPFVDGPFGSSINTKQDYIESGITVLRMLNVKPFNFIADNYKYVSERKFSSLERHNVKSGDILFSKVGAGIGEACIVPEDFEIGMLATTGITRLRVGQVVLVEYLCYFLNANKKNFRSLSSNTAQPFLNMTMIKMFKFPLPPLAEQQAIVSKVSELMAMIDELEKQVSERKEQSKKLMQSVLREAFAVS